MNLKNKKSMPKIRWQLVPYDAVLFLIYTLTASYRWGFMPDRNFLHSLIFCASLFVLTTFIRMCWMVYSQVWRYGGIQSYVRILFSDLTVYVVVIAAYLSIRLSVPDFLPQGMTVIFLTAICGINCLLALSLRMMYRFAYKCGDRDDFVGKVLRLLLRIFAGVSKKELDEAEKEARLSGKINIAILGAGTTGVSLAEELISNNRSYYKPVCFIDNDKSFTNRQIFGLPVYHIDKLDFEVLNGFNVREIIFAIPESDADTVKKYYDRFHNEGFGVKIYDYPIVENMSGNNRRSVREFNIEELLFRKPRNVISENAMNSYAGKKILVTGGGGSIGSELCRQLSRMKPAEIIILDVYENGAYDLQQELKAAAPDQKITIEILSVCKRSALETVFAKYRPDIVIHAAAHKHVPLMEHNCTEAVENNIFGTLNVIDMAEKYGARRFIMVSTDKAVNPTNVMGATKRFCEIMVMNRAAKNGNTVFTATRFGNVLGSAGSVIPLFKRQIAAGGPVTVTDKRIIRYFMTIPEASQLVLESGAMAKNGELFVLDMGNPVKIYDLAENMIILSGLRPGIDIKIIETGLRPGEKLYEELLIKSDTLAKTDNNLIFVEKDRAEDDTFVSKSLAILRKAVDEGDDDAVRAALASCVTTFRTPESVNSEAQKHFDSATESK